MRKRLQTPNKVGGGRGTVWGVRRAVVGGGVGGRWGPRACAAPLLGSGGARRGLQSSGREGKAAGDNAVPASCLAVQQANRFAIRKNGNSKRNGLPDPAEQVRLRACCQAGQCCEYVAELRLSRPWSRRRRKRVWESGERCA